MRDVSVLEKVLFLLLFLVEIGLLIAGFMYKRKHKHKTTPMIRHYLIRSLVFFGFVVGGCMLFLWDSNTSFMATLLPYLLVFGGIPMWLRFYFKWIKG